jgi:hypothetical protein
MNMKRSLILDQVQNTAAAINELKNHEVVVHGSKFSYGLKNFKPGITSSKARRRFKTRNFGARPLPTIILARLRPDIKALFERILKKQINPIFGSGF